MKSKISPIYVVGDSHVDVFSGFNSIQPEWPKKHKNRIPLFRTHRLGALLAFNLPDKTHTSYLKLMKCIDKLPNNSTIMLIAGEVDCRVHLVKQSKLQHKSITEVSELCATKYFELILQLKKMGFTLLACAVLPSTPFAVNDSEYPTVGTYNERNKAAKAFNRKLKDLCQKNTIEFVSIYNKLFINNKLANEYFIDSIHLSTKALPLYFEELNKVRGLNKKMLSLSTKIEYPDLAIQRLKRKTLSFWLQRSTFYPSIQKCVQYLKRQIN